MTLTTQSLAMAVPLASQAACNTLMDACFRGPSTFSVPIRDKVTLVRVAYGAHTYDYELITFFTGGAAPAGITFARLQAYGFATVAAARTTAALIRTKVMADQNSVANIIALLAAQGREIEPWAAP
jgi:hypothetical protein